MADFKVTKVSDAVVDKGIVTKPASFEFCNLTDAIDENGMAVKVRSPKQNTTIPQVTKQIEALEIQLAKLKAIKAEMEK